jgi:NTP pyrophosphatase (non-canonical NTP hydrolase)
MDFKEYQIKAWETAIYPNKGKNFVYPALGLGGEAGEVLEKIKKVLRDEKNTLTEEKKLEILNEMGDVLWYLAALSTELNLNLEEIAKNNLYKLKSRKERNKLHGSGDKR